jgi:hypothetical protein
MTSLTSAGYMQKSGIGIPDMRKPGIRIPHAWVEGVRACRA